jgi:superfamily II DNA or RNA helicase
MQDEFPELEYKNYQDKFLSDWWSRKKLFKGMRQSGKTTLILCEMNRFLNRGMDVLVLAPRQRQAIDIKRRYEDHFGEVPDCDISSFASKLLGHKYDVVLVDEAQEMKMETFHDIQSLCPMFIRLSAQQNEVRDEVECFCNSVYQV